MRKKVFFVILVVLLLLVLTFSYNLYSENELLKKELFNKSGEIEQLEKTIVSQEKQGGKTIASREQLITQLATAVQDRERKITELPGALKDSEGKLRTDITNLTNQVEELENQRLQLGLQLGFLEEFLVALSSSKHSNSKRIVPIYFYPIDITPDPDYPAVITKAMAKVQAWYALQLNKTFDCEPVVIIKGKHECNWYREYDTEGKVIYLSKVFEDIYSQAFEDIYSQQDKVPPSVDILYLIFMQGAGETAVGGHNDFGASAALVGNLVLERISKPDSEFLGIGVIVHELGHAFGLSHPPEDRMEEPTVMGRRYGEWPEIGLLPYEIKILLMNPFFY